MIQLVVYYWWTCDQVGGVLVIKLVVYSTGDQVGGVLVIKLVVYSVGGVLVIKLVCVLYSGYGGVCPGCDCAHPKSPSAVYQSRACMMGKQPSSQ